MKKLLSLALVLLLLTGCASAPAEETLQAPSAPGTASAGTEDAGETTREPEAPVFDDRLITEISQSGTIAEEGDPEPRPYHMILPQLLHNTEDALTINSDIISLLPQQGQPYYFLNATWESFWDGSLVTLLLTLTPRTENGNEYAVFHYDFETGKALTNRELALRLQLTPEDLENRIRRAAAGAFDRMMAGQTVDFPMLAEMRSQTLGTRNLPFDRIPLFADATGTLHASLTLSTPAGGGYVQALISLEEVPGREKTVSDGYVTAELKDNQVFLTYDAQGDSFWSLDPDMVPHGVPIPVEGLYGSYTDLAMGNIAMEFWPVLLILDTQGQVSFCDLMPESEADVFRAIGPLPGLPEITGFTEENGKPMGLDPDGNPVDLYQAIYDACFALPPSLLNWSFTTEDGEYALSLGQWEAGWSDSSGELASGLVNYTGMDEKGMHFVFHFFAGGDPVYGELLFFPGTPPEGFWGDLQITNLSGNSIAGLPAGATVPLFPR